MTVRPHFCVLLQYSMNTMYVCMFVGCRITKHHIITKPTISSVQDSVGLHIHDVKKLNFNDYQFYRFI